MTYEEALKKAIACLKLSECKGATPDEAALAAAKAQEIMDRYNLKIDDIKNGVEGNEREEDIKNFDSDPLHEVCQVDTQWSLRLASTVARLNSCRIYWQAKMSGSAIFKIIGRPSDVNTVRYLFGWMDREVRRLTRQECQGHSRRYQIDFRAGVVDTIQRKLEAQRKQTFKAVQTEAANPMALVRVQTAIAKVEQRGLAVDKWMEQNMKLRQTTFRKQADITARLHGQAAGEQIQLNQAKGAIGTEKPTIERE